MRMSSDLGGGGRHHANAVLVGAQELIRCVPPRWRGVAVLSSILMVLILLIELRFNYHYQINPDLVQSRSLYKSNMDYKPHYSITASTSKRPDCQDCHHIRKPSFFGDPTYEGVCTCLEQHLVPAPGPFTLPVPGWDDNHSTTTTATTATTVPYLYLDLVKSVIINSIYRDTPATIDGRAPVKFDKALTMAGRRRVDSVHEMLETIVREGIPGDFMEAGAWRAGVPIFVAAFFKVYNQLGPRRVFLADSFRGIPPPDPIKYPADAAHINAHRMMHKQHNTPQAVLSSFHHFHLYDPHHIRILEGYFNETLPKAISQKELTRFALVRVDADTYESTMDALVALYPLVVPGGFIVMDDYMDWVGCHQATLDFREKYGVNRPGEELVAVYHDLEAGEVPRGVWWQKRASTTTGTSTVS